MGGCGDFRLQNSLIRHIYATKVNASEKPGTELEAKHKVLQKVASQDKYWYNYHEYFEALLLKSCCCCFKKTRCYARKLHRLEQHQEAVAKLVEELDIVRILKVTRLATFMSKLVLRRQQRNLVNAFKRYEVDKGNGDQQREVQEDAGWDRLIRADI